MEGRPYTAGGIKTTVAATRARQRRATRGQPRPAHRTRRCGPARRPSRPSPATASPTRTSAARCRSPTATTRHVPRRPRRPARARRRHLRRTGQGRDARRLRAARRLDRRLLRGRRVRRRADERDPQAGIAKGLTPACTPTSSGTARASRSRSSWTPPRPTTAPTPPTTTSTRSRTPTPWPRCCPAPSSPPERSTRTPGGSSTPASTVALAADCNPGSSYTTNIPFCIAIAVREMRMTPDEAVRAATLGGAQALRRTDIGHLGAGRPSRCRRARSAHPHPSRLPARRPAGRGGLQGRPQPLIVMSCVQSSSRNTVLALPTRCTMLRTWLPGPTRLTHS